MRAEDSAPPPRRRFFTAGLRALIEGAEQAGRSLGEKVASGLGGPGGAFAAADRTRPPAPAPLLRPPGALAEVDFAATCRRSGECVAACPVQALQPLRAGDPARRGTPHLVPSLRACVVCDDLACMKACPSGALTLVPRTAIKIGLAVVQHRDCARERGDACRECIDRCPIGSTALGLDAAGRVEVRAAGCVGCGVCELYCPVVPRAITIRPLAEAAAAR